MATYEMQESNLPNEEGRRILYPRMQLTGQYTLRDMAKKISQGTTYSAGEIIGLVQQLTEEVAAGMAFGLSVKIDGLGIFTPALGLSPGAEPETGEPGAVRRNAQSIEVSGVRFRADKSLVQQTARQCRLERSDRKFRKSSQRYTPPQRLALAQEYLEAHPFLTVGDYALLTGLRQTKAAQELKEWSRQDTSGLRAEGRGTHRVYVRR